jgi:hypothetical protein
MRDNWFVRGIITNIVSAILVAGAGVVITVLARNASLWTTPVLYGLSASALLSISILAFRAMVRIPRARTLPTIENIESLVRLWLDNFRLGVRNDPNPETFFRLIVTMDSGTKLVVGRPIGELSGYLIVRGEITQHQKSRDGSPNFLNQKLGIFFQK